MRRSATAQADNGPDLFDFFDLTSSHRSTEQAVGPKNQLGKVYYNENADFPIAWLRELCAAGAIPGGTVDGRSIEDVAATDLADHDICHFFAGVGGWSYALEQAGWPRSGLRTWSASLPCQPFSRAGRRRGVDDPRHLWPVFLDLVRESKPAILLGEQVSSPDGFTWLETVLFDLEREGYVVGALDFPACGVGAPHRRQRLYWFAARLADAAHIKRQLLAGRRPEGARWQGPVGDGSAPDSNGTTAGFWADATWMDCIDGFQRPLEPGSRTLADKSPGGVECLRAYGNAVVAEAAAHFAAAVMDAIEGHDFGLEERRASGLLTRDGVGLRSRR